MVESVRLQADLQQSLDLTPGERPLTCRMSRLNSSSTLGLIPPETTLWRHSSRKTVLTGASWLIKSRIEFSCVARSTPATRSVQARREHPKKREISATRTLLNL